MKSSFGTICKFPMGFALFVALTILLPLQAQANFSYVIDELVFDETGTDTMDVNYTSGNLSYDGSWYNFPGSTSNWGVLNGATLQNGSKGPRLTAPANTNDAMFSGGANGGQFSLSADYCDFQGMDDNQYLYHFGLSSGNGARPAAYQASLEAMWATGTFNGQAYTNVLVLAPGIWLMSDDNVGEEDYYYIDGLDPTKHTIGLRYAHQSSTVVNFYYRINKGDWIQFHTETAPNGYLFQQAYPAISCYLSPNPSPANVPGTVLNVDIPADFNIAATQLLLLSGTDPINNAEYFPFNTAPYNYTDALSGMTGSLNYVTTGLPPQFTTPGLMRQNRVFQGVNAGGHVFKYVDGFLTQYGTIWPDGTYARFTAPQAVGELFVPGETKSISFTRTDYNVGGSVAGPGSDTYTIQTEGPVSVTVPAGTYSAYKVTVTDVWTDGWGQSGTDVFQYWLAKDEGIVRLHMFWDEDDSTYDLQRTN